MPSEEKIPGNGKQVENTGRPQIHIYIGRQYREQYENQDGCLFVLSSDEYFDNNVAENEPFLRECKDIIAEIDGAEILPRTDEYATLSIRTPFGVTDIINCSTGLKTVLNCLYLTLFVKDKKVLANISECGDNAVNLMLNKVGQTHVRFYLTHGICIDEENFELADYFVNGVQVTDIFQAIHAVYQALDGEG